MNPNEGTEQITSLADQFGTLTFERPFVLFALIIPLLLLRRSVQGRAGKIAFPFDFSKTSHNRIHRILPRTYDVLPPLLLAAAIIAAAVPMKQGSPVIERRLTNIEFCVDCSGSMTAPFGEGNRYDASMAAINQFLTFRDGDAFGLTFFATDVVRWCPLTRDVTAFECSLPFMRPDAQRAIGGGTMIGRALTNCRLVLEQQQSGDRMIILVSDGMSGDLMNGGAERIARELRDSSITVFAVHIGGSEIPADIVALTQATGGEAFVSGEPEVLERIFSKIDQMTPAELQQRAVEFEDWLQPAGLAGLLLLACWSLAAFGLRYTPW